MRFTTRPALASGILLFALFSLGCASKPEQEIQLARAAMDEARKVQADLYAVGDWNSANEAWDQAQPALANARWMEARTLLLRAKSRFEKAQEISKAKRDDTLREVEGMQRTIASRYKSLKYGIMNTRLPVKKQKALAAACAEIDELQATLKASLEGGKLLEARTSAQNTLKRIYEAEKVLGGSVSVAPPM